MTSSTREAHSVEDLVAIADVALEGADASADLRSLPLLALELCLAILETLSEDQKRAVAAAGCYLANGDKEDADRWINDLATRVGRPYPLGTDEKSIAEDRLVWIALNRNTELSGYGVEFVLWFGERAGIPFDQLLAACREVFPSWFVSGGE